MQNRKANTLMNIFFAVPICTFAISVLIELLIHFGDNIDKSVLASVLWNLIGAGAILAIACIVVFVVCLVNLKNKEVPLYKKLIGAGLNLGAFLVAMYVIGGHF